MSWIDEALPILRILLGDDEDGSFTYCDTRLSDLLVGVAKLLVCELSFDINYTVTVSTSTISPDPSTDSYFIPLLVLKAASKVANSEYRTASLSSGSVSDGPSSINLGQSAIALKARMDSLQKDYDNAKLQYSIGNAIGCLAVLSTSRHYYSRCYHNGLYHSYNCQDY